MDDVRALQDACLRDRQERDQWRQAFLVEQDKSKNLELRLKREAEHAAKLLEAIAQRRKAHQGEVTAAVLYQKTLLELTTLQQTHLEVQQAHHEAVESLRDQLGASRRGAAELASQLEAERAGRGAAMADLTQQLEARAAAHAAEVAALHENYGGRLALLEDFKNQLLADKAAAEERWAKERSALKAQQAESAAAAAAASSGGGGGDAAWKSRLMRLRAEADGLRRERDAALAAMHSAGISPPPSASAATTTGLAPQAADGGSSGSGGGGGGGGGGFVAGPNACPPTAVTLPRTSAAAGLVPRQQQMPQPRLNPHQPLHKPQQPSADYRQWQQHQQQQQLLQQHPHLQQQQPQPHPANQPPQGNQGAPGRVQLRGGGGLGTTPRMALGGPMGRLGTGGAAAAGATHSNQPQPPQQPLQQAPTARAGHGGAPGGAGPQPGGPGARG